MKWKTIKHKPIFCEECEEVKTFHLVIVKQDYHKVFEWEITTLEDGSVTGHIGFSDIHPVESNLGKELGLSCDTCGSYVDKETFLELLIGGDQ